MAVNKVVYNDQILIDLTQDTVTEDTMLSGIIAHDKAGNKITGTIQRKSSAHYIPRAEGYKISAGQYLSGDQIIPANENFTAANIAGGVPIWGITGTFSNDATVKEGEVLSGKTYYAQGLVHEGTMPNNGGITGYITDAKNKPYFTIPQGYHDGSGKVSLTAADLKFLVPGNIKQGITILGIEGEMTGAESVTYQEKTVTPTTETQIITPDADYQFLSKVTVDKIPYEEADNEFGGTTVTIG